MRKSRKKHLTLVILIAIIAAVLILSFLTTKKENMESSEPQGTDVSVYYDGDTCVQTKYITLHMPEQWSDCLRVVQREIGNSLEYDFYCSISGKEDVKLFVINFSKEGEYYYGKITTEKREEIHISLTAADLSFDDNWSAEEIDEVCAMQEASNYLVEQLRKENTFTEN